MAYLYNISSNISQPLSYCESLDLFYLNLPKKVYIMNYITCILNLLTSLTATVGNSLVLILLLRKRCLHNNANILLIWLSTSDLITGLITQPLVFIRDVSVLKRKPICSLFSASSIMSTLCVGWSLLTLALITTDRYLSLFFPFSYNIQVTKKRILIVASSSWACWLVVDLCAFYRPEIPDVFVVYFFSVLISSTLILASVVYWRIFFMAKRHRSSILSQRRAAGHDTRDLDGEYRIMSRTLLIVVFMFLCYAPSFLLLVVGLAKPEIEKTASPSLWPWLNWLVFCNSSINVILYCLRVPTLRNEIMRFFKLDVALARVRSWELSTTRTNMENNQASPRAESS